MPIETGGTYLGQPDDNSYNIDSQLNRWVSFIGQWETAMQSGRETCVLGDMNLNFLTWMNTNAKQTAHARKLQPLVNILFDRIIPHDFSQSV